MGEGRHGPPGVQALGRAWPACRGMPRGAGRPRNGPARPRRRQLLAAGQHLGIVAGAMDSCFRVEPFEPAEQHTPALLQPPGARERHMSSTSVVTT